jgi:hypothetical protein
MAQDYKKFRELQTKDSFCCFVFDLLTILWVDLLCKLCYSM